jgi:hypothetical protein
LLEAKLMMPRQESTGSIQKGPCYCCALTASQS